MPSTPNKIVLTDADLSLAAERVARLLLDNHHNDPRPLRLYPVPRGGVPAAYLVRSEYNRMRKKGSPDVHFVNEIRAAHYAIDDLVDSGKTRDRICPPSINCGWLSLFDKQQPGPYRDAWLVFPWEVALDGEDKSTEDIFVRLLQFIGEDPERGGLVETPRRMAKAWEFWSSGYKRQAAEVLKSFEDGAEGYDEMIHTAPIPFYSQCEHHLAPFFGTVQFAYIPDKRIVGLSKFYRLIDIFARRLQVQERLTVQIIDAFVDELKPRGAACVVKARHLCMESRGICQQGIFTTTSALRGVFKDQPETRAEFYSLANGH